MLYCNGRALLGSVRGQRQSPAPFQRAEFVSEDTNKTPAKVRRSSAVPERPNADRCPRRASQIPHRERRGRHSRWPGLPATDASPVPAARDRRRRIVIPSPDPIPSSKPPRRGDQMESYSSKPVSSREIQQPARSLRRLLPEIVWGIPVGDFTSSRRSESLPKNNFLVDSEIGKPA